MGRMVLLLHELPDGSSHYDWLLERFVGEALIAFRVGHRVDGDDGVGREFAAERMVDHRAVYLTYEGSIHAKAREDVGAGSVDGGSPLEVTMSHRSSAMGVRGRVRRVAEGECEIRLETREVVVFRIRFEGGEWRVYGASSSDGVTSEAGVSKWCIRREA